MASIEKMFKMMLEQLQQTTIPLNTIIKNQEIMIIQNKQLLEFLEQARISSAENNE